MRLTTGKFKNKKIEVPKGIRPTQEKVRKAIFDILKDIEGLSFLELFAGSGAVGFEALSRGAKDLTLVEYNPRCLMAIKKNIKSLMVDSCSLYSDEAASAIKKIFETGKKFDIIFLDPPYRQESLKKVLQIIDAYDILAPCGFVIVQHFKKDSLGENLKNLHLVKQYNYGDTLLSFLEKSGPQINN